MKFKLTQVYFNFANLDEPITDEYKKEVTDDIIDKIWEADNEDNLIEKIKSSSGWDIDFITCYPVD